MKLALFALVVALACASGAHGLPKFIRGRLFENRDMHKLLSVVRDSNITEQWYTQRLDHFDEANAATWQQRYWINDQFFLKSNGNGPVFLMIGGEGEENPIWMTNGAWIKYAQKYVYTRCAHLDIFRYLKSVRSIDHY